MSMQNSRWNTTKYKVKRRRNKSVSRKNKKSKKLEINTNIDSENTNRFNELSDENASCNSNCSKNNDERNYNINQGKNESHMENNVNIEKDNGENGNFFKCKNKNCTFEIDKKDTYCNICVNYVRNCVKCDKEFASEITILDICDNCDYTDNESTNFASNDNISKNNVTNYIDSTNTNINRKDIIKEDIVNEISKLLEIATFTINTLKEIFDLVNKGNPKKVFNKLIKITNNVSNLNKIPEDFNNIVTNIINILDKI
jgi:hypothetical protein